MRALHVGALLVVLMTVPAMADQKWGMVGAVSGRALLVRSTGPMPVELKRKDRVFPGDRIEAEEAAQVLVLLFGKSGFVMEEATSLGITERGIELLKGKGEFKVAGEDLLMEGEVYEIRTPNASAWVRAASVSVAVDYPVGMIGAAANHVTTKVCALRGSVRVDAVSGTRIRLDPRECATIIGSAPDVERSKLGALTAPAPPTRTLPRLHP